MQLKDDIDNLKELGIIYITGDAQESQKAHVAFNQKLDFLRRRINLDRKYLGDNWEIFLNDIAILERKMKIPKDRLMKEEFLQMLDDITRLVPDKKSHLVSDNIFHRA